MQPASGYPKGLPSQSSRTLLDHAGTLALIRAALPRDDPHEFELLTKQTPLGGQISSCWEWIPNGLLAVN